jgi:streptomycin 3"-adenylyltransferase
MREQTDQVQAATEALCRLLGDSLLAVYLHGSAVLGGLRPQSDIDLLAVIRRPMADDQRRHLLSALLQMSGLHPAKPDGPRCIEVIVFHLPANGGPGFPARAEFTYGEWLRNRFEAGEMPVPTHDPENTLILAQARQAARPLFGPNVAEVLPEIPPTQVRRAMHNALPALLHGLRGDERNVLLTLARMWRTAKTGEFVSKDAAATWAVPQMPVEDAVTLDFARGAYLGFIEDDWNFRWSAAQRAADYLRERVSDLLSPPRD